MFLYTNRAKTQLARNMSVNDTTLTLMSGTGDLFPALSESDDSFPVTLASANNPDNYEIVYCIARNGDVLTVKRGQEGLSPKNFMSGDVVSLNMTASTYRRMPQAGYLGTFQTEIATSPGGYHRGALVNDDSTPTLYWINLQDGNSTRPGANNPTWQALDVSSVVHSPDIEGFVSGTLDLSEGDKQGVGLHTRGSDQAVLYKDSANEWRPLALQSTVTSLDSAKLNRTGDTASGNLVYQSDASTSPWASTPQTVFRFKNSKALGSLFGQIRDDGSFQTLLYSQNVDGINKAWGFRSNDGHVATPNNHTLLEVDDAGDGHVIAQNIGSATGKKLATTDDNAALERSKLNRSGDVSSGNIFFDAGNVYQNWAGSPQTLYRIGGGLASTWAQVDGSGDMRLLLGGNNPGQPYAPWIFNPARKTASTPSGNNILETGNIAAPRMRQCFRVAVYNGGTITWPIPYARDDTVVASFTPTDNGSGQVHIVNLLVGTTTNRLNCVVAVATWNKWNSGNMKADPDPVTIDVTVEGYTA